jgi:AcrR family transcriptional regulator
MPTPTRILRKIAEDLDPTMRDRTEREERQLERIMKVAPTLLTFWNTDRITFTALATAMKMAPATLRRHFVDIPALLGYLIRRHLRAISTALAQTPRDAPDRPRLRRAAYLEFTRKPLGAHTEIHLLMLNNLANLPDDVRAPLIALQHQIASTLAPPGQADFVLSMIENPFITPRRLEAIIATPEYAWHEPAEAPAPQPEPDLALALAEPAPFDAYVPAATDDLSKISGVKIPGGEIWIKRTHVPLDSLPDDALAALLTPPAPHPATLDRAAYTATAQPPPY